MALKIEKWLRNFQGAIGINFIKEIGEGGNFGWEGEISAINNNSFDITFTQESDGGLDITGQFHLEEQ